MKHVTTSIVFLAAFAATSCGGSKLGPEKVAAKPPAPAIPPEIQHAAENLLGSEAEVLLFGDLVRNNLKQALVINRLKKRPENTVPGILVTCVSVIEKDGGFWQEVFRCDEHLKNPKGYLGGIPLAVVPAWRLQYEQSPEKGLSMYFTPLAKPEGGYIQTISVRWNPMVKRYQTLDRNFERFLTEVPTLEPVKMNLHQ